MRAEFRVPEMNAGPRVGKQQPRARKGQFVSSVKVAYKATEHQIPGNNVAFGLLQPDADNADDAQL